MINKKIKIILGSIVFAFLLTLCPGFVRSFSLRYEFWLSYIAYFIAVLFLLKKYSQYSISIIISFITILIIFMFIFISNGIRQTVAFPNIVGDIIACLAAFIFYKIKKIVYKIIIVILSLFICSFYFFYGIEYYLSYISYGSFSGKLIDKKIIPEWSGLVSNYQNVYANKNCLMLFDFYNTSCGICFRKFPLLQNTYDKYKNNPKISIYAVNIPLPRDTPGMALKVINDRKYTFPVLLGRFKLDSIFGVECYPTTILFRNDTMLYKGDIDNIDKVILDELK